MSANPRQVLAAVEVPWGEPGCSIWVRAGTAVDIRPGSLLETAYGGPSNLGPLPAGEPQNADKSALSN